MAGRATFDFSGQTVLITGGSSGIGAAIAETFAHANANVVVGARCRDTLESIAARFPGRISTVQMDIHKDEDRRRAVDTVIERHGQLDVLVNNAAYVVVAPFEKLAEAEITAMYDSLLGAPTCLIHLALPHLKKTKGCVVNISSVVGRAVVYPPTGDSVYGAGKAGLNQLTRTLASELGPFGIRLNAVSPGPTVTEMLDKTFRDYPAIKQTTLDTTPLGRLGQPSEIATVVAFLASDAGGWVTGQVIDAAGGWHISP